MAAYPFVLSHWRGRSGLARSFGVALLLVQSLVGLLLFLSFTIASSLVDPREQLLAHVIALALSVPLELWGWVGLFRAGRAHGGLAGLGVQALAGAGVLMLSVGGAGALAAGVLAARFLIEGQGLRPGTVALEGNTLRIRGDISWAAADQAIELVSAARGSDAGPLRVRVHSSGGALGAATFLSRRLREEPVEQIYVDQDCTSACTVLLEVSPKRVMVFNGIIRVHLPHIEGLEVVARQGAGELRASYQRAGISTAWIEAALSTPHDRLYRAPTRELIANNVITHIERPDGSVVTGEAWIQELDQREAEDAAAIARARAETP